MTVFASLIGAVLATMLGGAPPPQPGFLSPTTIGRSSEGRPIRLTQYGDPAVSRKVLVFGCIHGDECAGRAIVPIRGCPPRSADEYVVPNLDPDGFAAGSRLNGRGVDLNRNFPAGWKPIGHRGSPEFSGPRPFSEPETRLAARVIRALRPAVTVWFHQERGLRAPYVRAWGQSIPAGRRLARLARIRFAPMPWLAGTAPNWQNHTFPGSAAFVVELPRGPLRSGAKMRLEAAILSLAEGQ